jgi:hypothetical protein
MRRYTVSPQGIALSNWNLNAGVNTPDRVGSGIVFTVEDVKDVVSPTGLSLVVR